MDIISSMQNPRIRAWRSLKLRQGREEQNAFLVEGFKSVQEALQSSFQIRTLIIQNDLEDLDIPTLSQDLPVCKVPRHLLEAICDTKTPQGIAAVISLENRRVSGTRLLALDGVQDPGNVGTILRTADAAGLDGLLLSSQCADIYSPKVLRASMGSIFHLPCEVTDDLPGRLQSLEIPLLASRLEGEPFFALLPSLPSAWCLIIGNEGNGISPEVTAVSTYQVRLPMRGKAESLNAAIAAGIMMYALTNR